MDAAVANYPIPRWWDSFRSLATQPLAHTPNIDPRIEQGGAIAAEDAGGAPDEPMQ
jgi:hypothetical protein